MAMGLLIGGLATAVIERVVDLASTHIEDCFRRRMGMEKKLQRLKMLLPQIQSVVDAAERGDQQISDPLKEWLWQLKDALYEADDVVDESRYLRLKQQVEADADRKEKLKVRELMSRSRSKAVKFAKHIFKPDPALDKLMGVVKKLDEVAAGVGNFVTLVSNRGRELQQQETRTTLRRRETGPLLTENKVFGREKERDELLRWLMPADHEGESKMDVDLFSVVGHGGMGKTALAQLVYNDETIQNSFDLKIWVCVSTSFDVREITRSILESATKQRPNVDGLPALQDALKEKLKTSGKFLLVLDDVWNDDNNSNWSKLLAPLKYGRKGSIILLTTRMDRVAEVAARAMGESTKGPLKLGGLHGEDFYALFNHYAFAGVDYTSYQNLQWTGMQIAERLGSSPLAAKTVGGLLNSNLDDRYWTDIFYSKNIPVEAQHGDDNIMSILMLSYHHLPLHLRPCFAYCSMFPKNHWFRKGDLVLMWMAAGLIRHSHQNQGGMLENMGGYYFDELLRRSLFDHTYDDSYVMHDLLHDMAQSVSHGECYSFVGCDKIAEDIIPNTVRHLYIEIDNLDLLTKMDHWHSLRSLVLIIKDKRSEHFSVLEKVFKSLKSIRLLNIGWGNGEVTVPDAFNHLIHLRNLKIHGTLKKFPRSLCKLYHLQVIRFSYKEGTIKLPENMNKLVNLRYLSANNQVAGVGILKFLQELSFTVKNERAYKIGELKDLIWLRSLDVKGLENVENQEEASTANLYNKKYLQTLCLGWSISSDSWMDKHELILDRLQPHFNLKDLTIEGYGGIIYPDWMLGFELISNLQCIRLANCSRLDHLPPLGRLPFLEKLELRNMPAIKKLDFQCQRLKNLHIDGMEGLEELSESGTDANRWHPHLHTLRIENCPKLKVMPSLSVSIREIRLCNLGLVSIPTLWLDHSNTCSTSDLLSSSSSLPSSLEVFQICDCGKITSLGNGLLMLQHYLTALERLEIQNCPELVDFPSGGLQHLRALKNMRIWDCPKLQVASDPITPDGNVEKFLPLSLQSLLIKGCAELVRSMPALLKGFVSLGELTLMHCEELSSLEGLMGFRSIGRLSIESCPKLAHAADTGIVWSDFTLALEDLVIDDPSLLVSGVLRSLSSVRHLYIQDCRQLESDMSTLEQWMLQNQSTLEIIWMDQASSLNSLPDILKNLSSLKFLRIFGASDTLIERCTKDEGADWPNIKHIPSIILRGLGLGYEN